MKNCKILKIGEYSDIVRNRRMNFKIILYNMQLIFYRYIKSYNNKILILINNNKIEIFNSFFDYLV